MKTQRKLILLFILSATHSIMLAQTVTSTVEVTDWRLLPLPANNSFENVSAQSIIGSQYTDGISTGIIRMDDNSIISGVSLPDDQSGVIRLNKDMSKQWLTNIDGSPVAIGFFNSKLLVISKEESNYTGSIIDEKTGKMVLKKNILDDHGDFFQQPIFLFSPDGAFFKIALRISNFKRDAHIPDIVNKLEKEINSTYFTTNDFSVSDFDANLNVKNVIKPTLEPGWFLGGIANSKGDVFFLTESDGKTMELAKYENGKTTPVKILQQEVITSSNILRNITNNFLVTSKTDPSVLFFAGTFTKAGEERDLLVSKFDFNTNAVTSNLQPMGYDDLKALAKSFTPFNENLSKSNLGLPLKMRIKNLTENKGTMIVALTSTAGANIGGSTVDVSNDLLINIYDEQVDLKYQQIIPRKYSSTGSTRDGIGIHCANNLLYVVANNEQGFFGQKAISCVLDLKTGAVVSFTGIEKGDIKKAYSITPYTSLWFEKQFVLFYLKDLNGIQENKLANSHGTRTDKIIGADEVQLLNY